MVNRKAVATLPPPLRALFERNADYVSEHAIDPDLWRNAGLPDELPNHFLDMDAFGAFPFDAIPRVEAEHVAKHGKEAAAKGRVPWRVAEVYRDLVAAFRGGDVPRVLERAAVLGHYVGDAHVPLHANVNYDGQLTGQTGLHTRWESDMVDRFRRQIDSGVVPAPARRVRDPVAFTFDALLASFPLAGEALESDLRSAGPKDLVQTPEDDRYDDAYYSKLYEREGARIVRRLSRAATALGSLWLSAWEEAGRPALDTSFRFPYVRKASRGVLVSVDGFSAPILDDAVGRGVMPRLAQLRAMGAAARGSVTALPAKTAAGHAALFTGTWGDRSGITGNEMTVTDASVLEWNTGFTSTHLRAEPLWATAARQGLDATVVSAPQVYPFGPFLGERRFGGNYGWNLTLLDGYQNFETSDAVLAARDLDSPTASAWLSELPRHDGEVREVRMDVAGSRIDGLLYDDPDDPVRGFDTLYLGLDQDPKGGVTLKPSPARGADASAFAGLRLAIGGGEAAVYFRLFALSRDGRDILLYRSSVHPIRASRPRIEAAVFEGTGGFVGNGADGLYEEGALGPTLWQGGDGTAERRYLETVGLVARQFTRLTDFAMERTSWDLLVTYLPYPDEALHTWLGRLDTSVPGHDPALAARLRPFLDEALGVVDLYVGHIVDRAGSDAFVAAAADHGMIGASRVLYPNVALKRAGILATDAEGRIDLSRTRAFYFNSGCILVNGVSREGGIVRPEEEAGVRRDAIAALRGVKDPATGQPVVTAVLDPDLYLSVAPGYDVSTRLASEAVVVRAPKGVHFLDPDRPAMHAAFAIAGPGVASGVDLGLIRQIDIAPTLCALLGIEPPAQATGTVLTKALARH